MHRRIARSVFILLCGVVATGLGVVAALLFTGSGRSLLARLLTDYSPRLIRGSVTIGGIQGGWVEGFALEDVVIRDTAGVVLLSAPHLEVRYRLRNLLSGRIVLASAHLERPELIIFKHRSGRVNYEEILKLGEGAKGGASPLIELNDLEIVDGHITIRLPWRPDGRLRSAGQVDSALAYERSKPGRRIEPGPEGLEQIRTIERLNARLPLLRISTPDRQPITLDIAELAARVSDPQVEIRALRGNVRTKGDSLLFNLEHAELPGTAGAGVGRLDWPEDTLRYQFRFDAGRLALADLRFISPKFPDFTGAAQVRAHSLSNTRTEYDIRNLAVGDAASRVTGRMVAITDVFRGLGFRGLNVGLSNLDLEVVRPYLDTLPFYGRVSGPLVADGFFDQMTVNLDWLFQDARADGAQSQVALDGRLKLGGAEGLFFQNTQVPRSDIDLRTVRRIAPAVILEGRLALAGSLNGPLKNVTFQGDAEHRDGALRASRMRGTVRLDTRGALLGLETDVVLDSLAFDGIRRSFPTLEARGALGGSVKLSGFLDNLRVDATVGGALGQLEAHGRATVLPPRWGADSLQLRFDRLDLPSLLGRGPPTVLAGTLAASGVIDSGVAPRGRLALALTASRIREVSLDSATLVLSALDSLITLDTARAYWSGGRLDGAGTLGWIAPKTGRMNFVVDAGDLGAFDSLASALTGLRRDTVAGDSPLRGRARAELALEGALDAVRIQGTAQLDSARWLAYRTRGVSGKATWNQRERVLDAELTADSLWRRQLVFSQLGGQVRGRPDSLRWSVRGDSRSTASLRAGGRLQNLSGGRLLHADSLVLNLLGRTWALDGDLDARLTDSLIALDTVLFVTSDGSGSVRLAGELPRRGSGELTVTALGVALRDIYGVLQRDTTGIGGMVALDARLGGTAARPELRGSATLTGPVFGDFHAPLIRAAYDYRDQLLRGNLTFWRTGKPVVEADVTLPVDLALTSVPRRQLPGPLHIEARGDSIDLALVEAFTPNVRQVSGLLNLDAEIQGTWESPRLSGLVRVIGGAASVPGLGVRYRGINGDLRLSQDSILSQGLRLEDREGSLEVAGGVRLERLTTPVLNLALTARDFQLIDVNNYMALRASGEVQLVGTLDHPVLTGRGRLNNSVIYFADLVQKDIVDLETADPLYADLVDTLTLRKYSLGANFQSRFFDSLSVRDLQMEIGEGVWLRSSEANFQLEGRLLVNKTRFLYRVVGDLDTPRGTYTLNLGNIINRTFTVERGTVRYFGDLNAELDVEARHVVRTPQQTSEDIPVIAHITGTLFVPKLALTTPPDRPPMSEPQLISLLIVGSPDVLSATQLGANASVLTALTFNALSSELQRAIVSDLGFHAVDIIEIRPGVASSGAMGGATGTPTQLALGRSLGSKVFVTANAGFCFNSGQVFSPRNLGATLEYRFQPTLRAQLSAEPVQTCLLSGVNLFGTNKRYQFGAELRWDRSY